MPEEEPTPTPCVVICHTDGCPLVGEPRTVNLFPNAAPPVWRCQCSPCGQLITDITPQG
ncbi:hypothetical protein ACIQVT_34580 [Streptomyces sp. NPDC100445]|uniref:hypothetical protein n=1 Tax=Streptomyces sp. NPDC100445 TaxID=3366102 RepID=UPI00381B7D5A